MDCGEPTVRIGAIELADGLCCVVLILVRDECRALRPPGTIVSQLKFCDGPDPLK